MEPDKHLLRGIEKMRTGDISGFMVFYNKTFQLTCLFAAKTMTDLLRREDYLSELYPYLLLHIAELKDDHKVYSWVENVMPVFYELWAKEPYYKANRPIHPVLPSDEEIRTSSIRVWEMIKKKVIFPKTKKKSRIPTPIFIIAFLSLLLLFGCLMLLKNKNDNRADQETIDRINQENMDFSDEISSVPEEIEGLYTETTTEVVIHGGTESNE